MPSPGSELSHHLPYLAVAGFLVFFVSVLVLGVGVGERRLAVMVFVIIVFGTVLSVSVLAFLVAVDKVVQVPPSTTTTVKPAG